MLLRILSISLIFAFSFQLQAQTYTGQVADVNTRQPIPYATIEYAPDKGVIANDEGRFSFSDTIGMDSVYINCMGYERRGISPNSLSDSLILLKPKPIELTGVYLFDNPLTIEEIMGKTRENLDVNYRHVPLHQQFFLRESSRHSLHKFDIDIKKSTIQEIDKPLMDSIVSIVPRESAYYTETLGDFYRTKDAYKLRVTKAAELYDKSNDGSLEGLGERLEAIFKENVKPDSYLKFKSGIFSQKVQIDSIMEENDEAAEIEEEMKKPERSYFVSGRKHVLDDMIDQLFYQEDPKLDVFTKMNRYRFSLLGYTDIGNEGVYVVAFEPKRRADYKGRLFINIEDFGIMRIDFQNVKRLRNFNLFGITYRETAYKGTFSFSRVPDGPYALKFLEILIGREMGVDRPLKVVEKNKNVKGRRKQNELALDLTLLDRNFDKIEFVVFDTSRIDPAAFKAVKEDSTVRATYMPSYDPEFWKGYTIMEPNSAIREFKASDL